MWPSTGGLSLSLLLVGTFWQIVMLVSGVVALLLAAGWRASKPVSVDEVIDPRKVGHTRRAGHCFFIFAGISLTVIASKVAAWAMCIAVVGWSCISDTQNLGREVVAAVMFVVAGATLFTGFLPWQRLRRDTFTAEAEVQASVVVGSPDEQLRSDTTPV